MLQHVPIVIVGASLGGVAAALAACRAGGRVLMIGQHRWIGGQLTAQAVPPDDNPWVESGGASNSYHRLRQQIRAYYRAHYPLSQAAAANNHLNIGRAFASPLAHEPSVAHAVLCGMLAPYRSARRLTILTPCTIDKIAVDRDTVEGITFTHHETDETHMVTCDVLLDATDTGDALPLTGTEHITGAETHQETGEPSSATKPNPQAIQAMTVGFVIDHLPGEDHTIPRPPDYDTWRTHQPRAWATCGAGPQLSWTAPHPRKGHPVTFAFQPNSNLEINQPGTSPTGEKVLSESNLWRARRIIARHNFDESQYDSDITVVNWLQNDYTGGAAYAAVTDEDTDHVEQARALSCSLLYWMQTEAPHHDGGYGYPGLRPRPDQTGTPDGLAQAPYIRESRRIRALETVRENDIAVELRGDAGGRVYPDAVGIGAWWMDLHPTATGDGFIHLPTYPFEIPLGAIIPVRIKNLIPACKNIGTTHLTNGAYRVHHVEWAVGEAAGALAAYTVQRGQSLQDIYRGHADTFCKLLDRFGVRRHWDAAIRQTPIM